MLVTRTLLSTLTLFQCLAVTVRVWCCQSSSESRLCIMWDVHLSGLVYLAGKVGSNNNNNNNKQICIAP